MVKATYDTTKSLHGSALSWVALGQRFHNTNYGIHYLYTQTNSQLTTAKFLRFASCLLWKYLRKK